MSRTTGTSVTQVHLGVNRGSEEDDYLKLTGLFKGIQISNSPVQFDIKELISITTTKVLIPKSEVFDGEGGSLFVNPASSLNNGEVEPTTNSSSSPEQKKKKKTATTTTAVDQYENRLVRIGKKRNTKLSGTLNLCSIPSMLVNLDLAKMTLTGSIDLTALPHTLQCLNLGNNGFNGTLNLSSLPAQLSELHLEQNRFHGILDLSRLPLSMESLYVHGNLFDWLGVELGPDEEVDEESEGSPAGQAQMVDSEMATHAPPLSPPSKGALTDSGSSGGWVGGMDGGVDEEHSPRPAAKVMSLMSPEQQQRKGPPIRPFSFNMLPFKLKILNIANNRFKNKVDAKTGVRASCTVFE